MTYFAEVNGAQVVGGSLLIPLVGAWTADLVLAVSDPPLVEGPATVTIGTLTLHGTVYRAAAYGGSIRARLVGGAGGWRLPVPPQGYGSPSGVRLSAVLGDVAAACGETIVVSSDVGVGPAFARVAFPASVASDVLWQLMAQGIIPSWRVDVDGVTKTDAWPATVIGTPFIPTDQRANEGRIEIATEDYAAWLPGCVFSHPLLDRTYTSSGVEYSWGGGRPMRFDVVVGPLDRVVEPFRALVRAEVSPLRFFGTYEYVISNPKPTTIDGTPSDATLGLPDLQNVPIRGSSLASYVPPDGGKAHVEFVNGQPTRPVCTWTQADAEAGPTEVVLGPHGTGANGVARTSDTVTVLFPPIMQVAGTIAGAPFIGVITITTPAIGAIQTGSSVIKAAQSA